jgi:hypothetical protein
VTTLALCLAACSGNGGRHSSTTTTRHSVSTTTPLLKPSGSTPATTTTASASYVEANLGPCPKEFHFGSARKLNAGVAGIDKKFVPIAALRVRLCRYELVPVNTKTSTMRLAGSGVLRGARATQLEDLANHLPTMQTRGCSVNRFFLLTFADETHHVDLQEGTDTNDPTGCGPVNGALGGGQSTTQWLNELEVNTADRHP